ncbi:patatin-like phospholipase family protein [Paenibacillus sp. IHBB 3054]|uniref:patatin-like phospholipase family protein n=1 Tax=Paenibacillus sp. IHBB 3054 TaxID=3425689 RepID=UPI003F66178C
MKYPFRNLVFEGGGVIEVVFVGVMNALNDHKNILPNVVRVVGTSARAIVALLVGLNYSAAEISEELKGLDLTRFTNPK